MEPIIALFIPIGICVILPIMIVWLVTRSKNHKIDKKTEVLLKAIERGQEINPELFVDATEKENNSVKKILLNRLQFGVIFTLMGLSQIIIDLAGIGMIKGGILIAGGSVMLSLGLGYFAAYIIGKKMLAPEIEHEEKEITER